MPTPDLAASVESFKRDDAASYDDVADSFEHLTERFSLPMARRVVSGAALRPGARVLDVGCGTGVVARLAARQAAPGGHVVGLDLSDGMLRKAAELAARDASACTAEFRKGDAERLDFADGSFDAVLSLFALRHFPDPLQALREMFRVGRAGGRAVIGVGAAPPWPSVGFVEVGCRVVVERLQAMAGRGPLHAPRFLDGMLPDAASAAHGTADAFDDLAAAMREVGYRRVRTKWAGQTSAVESAEDFWNLQVTLSSRARKALQHMPAGEVQGLRRRFMARCEEHLRRGGRLLYRSGALIASGERP